LEANLDGFLVATAADSACRNDTLTICHKQLILQWWGAPGLELDLMSASGHYRKSFISSGTSALISTADITNFNNLPHSAGRQAVGNDPCLGARAFTQLFLA
jgi:hypothetical protein